MKKKITKIVSLVCICAILGSSVSAFATSNGEISLPSNIVAERRDVPLNVAMTDANFSLEAALNDKAKELQSDSAIQSRSVYWKVWGEKSLTSSTHLYKPVGYSEHRNGNTVLITFHYTRTFLGSELDPRGDSGRVWGGNEYDKGTVKATGTDCMQDVWDAFTHRVFYGSEG